jgi:hypothetical protein
MARVIPQNQPDPFAPQAARLYGTSSRPSTAFQTIGNTAGAIKSVADSPLTGLAIRGGQALKQGIEDYGLSKAAERRLAYETGLGAQESDADLEPYKPMQGLSLQGDQPEGLGLSLNDGTDWSADDKKPQGWSSESRMGELQSALGADLAKRAAAPAAPAARRRLADMGVLGAFTSPRAGTLPDEEVIRLEDVVRPAAPAAPQTPMAGCRPWSLEAGSVP